MAKNLEALAAFWEGKGNITRADLYRALAADERAMGGRETISEPEIEVVRQPISSETQRLIEHLGRSGYAVYDLAGESPNTLMNEGMKFWYVNPLLENTSSTPALVAFKKNPQEFFLRGSQKTLYSKQLALLEEEKARVEKEYSDAGLVVRVGKPSEYAEAAFKHFQVTGRKVRIFGRDYGYNYTWADAYENEASGARRAIVGWVEANGLDVDFSHPDDVYSYLGLAPLVEIPRK